MTSNLQPNNLKYIWDIKDKEISTSWDFFAQKNATRRLEKNLQFFFVPAQQY